MDMLGSAKKRLSSPGIIFIIILSLIASHILFIALISRPEIGMIRVEGAIMTKGESDKVARMLRYAGERREIKGVVIDINSPGGLASISEELHLQVLWLKRKKPVVASISGIGASGAYYMAVAGNYIYAKPSSAVGSVGVVGTLPEPEKLSENMLGTGPFKMGASRRRSAEQIDVVKEIFLRQVLTRRGEKLKISAEELETAEIYTGMEAERYGLVDMLGSTQDAIETAAKLGGVANYKVTDINNELGVESSALAFFVNTTELNSPTNTVPKLYYLYISQK